VQGQGQGQQGQEARTLTGVRGFGGEMAEGESEGGGEGGGVKGDSQGKLRGSGCGVT